VRIGFQKYSYLEDLQEELPVQSGEMIPKTNDQTYSFLERIVKNSVVIVNESEKERNKRKSVRSRMSMIALVTNDCSTTGTELMGLDELPWRTLYEEKSDEINTSILK
jgi:hypothetical protein